MNRSMARIWGSGALLFALAACGKDKIQGIPPEDAVNYDTDGGLATPSAKTCVTLLDCGAGEYCDQVDYTCQPDCNSTPLPPACGGGTDGGSCNCVAPQVCRNGACVDPGACGISLDVTTTPTLGWSTFYNMKLSSLLGFGQGWSSTVDTIDQALQGKVSSDPLTAFLAGMVAGWVQAHLPPWFPKAIHFLNVVLSIFDKSEIAGTMYLTPQAGTPDVYDGTERWDNFIVYNIDNCPGGLNDPTYPNCAKSDIKLNKYVSPVGIITATPNSFTASVCGSTFSADSRSGLTRTAQFDIHGLAAAVINLGVKAITGYNDVGTLVTHLIDCTAFSYGLTSDPTLQAALRSGCTSLLNSLAAQLTSYVNNIPTNWVMKWNQSATVTAMGGQASGMAQITYPTATGVISGGNVGGGWAATR